MKFSDNILWTKLENFKNQLKNIGEQDLANEVYKRQLKLEDELTKEFVCQNSKNLEETSTS